MSAEDVRTTTVGERQPEVQEKSVRSDANQPEAQDTLRIRAEDGDAISPMDSAREAAAQLNREVQQGHRTEGFLQANDDAGGHTLDRHVGKTDDHLLERASQAKRGEASSFEGTPAEPRIAEAAIADVLRTRSA